MTLTDGLLLLLLLLILVQGDFVILTIERRNVTSRYHGSKICGSPQ